MNRLCQFVCLFSILLSVTFATAQHAVLWSPDGSITDLGALKGGETSAYAINASGEIVGLATIPTGKFSVVNHAFAWTKSGGMVDIGVLRGQFEASSGANSINDLGIIVGRSGSGLAQYAVLWQPNRHVVNLGSLGATGNYKYSRASGVNRAGEVVGISLTDSGDAHGFLWSSANGMTDLGTLPGGTGSAAQGINNRGEVVGWSTSTDGVFAFSWTQTGGMVSLGWCPGSSYSEAYTLNHAGEVVGYCQFTDRVHAFLWRTQNGMLDLGTLGGTMSQAVGVNNHGVVVGFSQITGNGATHAFKWMQNVGLVDLGVPSGYSSCWAAAINDSGEIAGYCQ